LAWRCLSWLVGIQIMDRKVRPIVGPLVRNEETSRRSAIEEGKASSAAQVKARSMSSVEEGLRLNRAFFSIRDAAVREAIVALVAEMNDTKGAR
jgi:hypothetical protein